MWFSRYASGQRDRHTDTDTLIAILRMPIGEGRRSKTFVRGTAVSL